MFGWNLRNWTIGVSWSDEWVCVCFLCFGITFERTFRT